MPLFFNAGFLFILWEVWSWRFRWRVVAWFRLKARKKALKTLTNLRVRQTCLMAVKTRADVCACVPTRVPDQYFLPIQRSKQRRITCKAIRKLSYLSLTDGCCRSVGDLLWCWLMSNIGKNVFWVSLLAHVSLLAFCRLFACLLSRRSRSCIAAVSWLSVDCLLSLVLAARSCIAAVSWPSRWTLSWLCITFQTLYKPCSWRYKC